MARRLMSPSLGDVYSVSLGGGHMSERRKALEQTIRRSGEVGYSPESPTADRLRMVETTAATDEQAERESKWQFPENSSAGDPNIVQAWRHPVLGALRARVKGVCLFVHKWAIHTETRRDVHGFSVTSVIPYRTCERCGAVQRGIHDKFWRDIVWEPIRKGTDISPGRNRFFRQPSSPLDQLAHSWGFRRSRSGDTKVSEDAP